MFCFNFFLSVFVMDQSSTSAAADNRPEPTLELNIISIVTEAVTNILNKIEYKNMLNFNIKPLKI